MTEYCPNCGKHILECICEMEGYIIDSCPSCGLNLSKEALTRRQCPACKIALDDWDYDERARMTNKERHIIVWNNVIKRLKEAEVVTPTIVHNAKAEVWEKSWPTNIYFCSACIEANERKEIKNKLFACDNCPIAKKARKCGLKNSAWVNCVYAEKNIIKAIKYAIIIRDAWED